MAWWKDIGRLSSKNLSVVLETYFKSNLLFPQNYAIGFKPYALRDQSNLCFDVITHSLVYVHPKINLLPVNLLVETRKFFSMTGV